MCFYVTKLLVLLLVFLHTILCSTNVLFLTKDVHLVKKFRFEVSDFKFLFPHLLDETLWHLSIFFQLGVYSKSKFYTFRFWTSFFQLAFVAQRQIMQTINPRGKNNVLWLTVVTIRKKYSAQCLSLDSNSREETKSNKP